MPCTMRRGPRAGAWRAHVDVANTPDKREEFRAMPAWQRTAALFLNFEHKAIENIDNWDVTALACAHLQPSLSPRDPDSPRRN